MAVSYKSRNGICDERLHKFLQQQLCTLFAAFGVTIAASPLRSRQPYSRGKKCNRPGTHPTGSALRTGQGEELPLPFFRLRGDASPAVDALLLLLAGGDIELLHLQKTHPSRNGLPAMPGQLLHNRVTQATSLQRLPPVAADQLMEMSPT